MEQNQHQQRRVADQEFQESLNQLQDIVHESLAENDQVQTADITENLPADDLSDIDLAAFEDAVADIEQYLEEQTK